MRPAIFTLRQQGAALLLAVVAAAVLAAGLLVAALPDKRIDKYRRNAVVLGAAKEALLGYAVGKGNPPGALPCPDVTNANGTAASSCSGANMIGRLPWKTLGVGDLRDADGECLWYAVSPAFKNGVATLNANTAGTFTIKRDDGSTIASQAVAVVIAPGGAVAGNDRTPIPNAICAGNANAPNYLDAAGGISNASGNRAGNAFTFVVAESGDNFNDQLAYVTAAEVFAVVGPRVANEIRGDAANGLKRYFNAHANALPWASGSAGGTQQPSLANGYIPYADPGMLYPGSAWLNANGWFALARYQVVAPNQAKVSVAGSTYAYTLP